MSDHQLLVQQLIHRHPLLSEQITPKRLAIVLSGLMTVLDDNIPGDIVEFGCYIGTTSLFLRRILDAMKQPQRQLHVYDSFQGLPAKTIQDASVAGSQFQAGELKASVRTLKHHFRHSHLRPPLIHKAWFSDLTNQDLPNEIAFAFLDSDFYQSISDSLNLTWPKLASGGMIVIDDYSRPGLPGVTRAVQTFFNQQTTIKQIDNLAVIRKPA